MTFIPLPETQTGEQCFVLKTLLTLVASVDPFISRKTIHFYGK
jgi:hypothetical protein